METATSEIIIFRTCTNIIKLTAFYRMNEAKNHKQIRVSSQFNYPLPNQRLWEELGRNLYNRWHVVYNFRDVYERVIIHFKVGMAGFWTCAGSVLIDVYDFIILPSSKHLILKLCRSNSVSQDNGIKKEVASA